MARKAFVSSSYADLIEHRKLVIASLRKAGIGIDPMEDWTAAANEPKHFSVERVHGCDLMVLIVAFRRGHVPTGETKSITQLEYEAALTLGIDVLPFLLDEEANWQRKFDELDKDPEVRVFRRHLTERHGVGFFGHDPESIEIGPAITRWMASKPAAGSAGVLMARRVALLKWLARLPRLMGDHLRTMVETAGNQSNASMHVRGHLDSEVREIVNLHSRLATELPRAFDTIQPSEQYHRRFDETFTALERETEACLVASRKMREGVRLPVEGGGHYDLPVRQIYLALEVVEHLGILEMAAESIRDLFPPEEVEQSNSLDD